MRCRDEATPSIPDHLFGEQVRLYAENEALLGSRESIESISTSQEVDVNYPRLKSWACNSDDVGLHLAG